MHYDVVESGPSRFPEWLVEAINAGGEGELYSALFSGPDAQRRAEEYAAWKNAVVLGASPVLGRPEHPRSPHWPSVRRAHLLREPACAVCGATDDAQVHHVQPFHLHPERELDPANFITLCERAGSNHHLLFGHLLDWHSWNPRVREDAAAWAEKIRTRAAA
jgi:5-methylcytosine-specific restriction enzyme A